MVCIVQLPLHIEGIKTLIPKKEYVKCNTNTNVCIAYWTQ